MCSVFVSVILLISVLICVNSKHREQRDKMARDVDKGDQHIQSERLECKNPLVGCGGCPCLYTKHILGDTFAADATTSTAANQHITNPTEIFYWLLFHPHYCFVFCFLIAKTCLWNSTLFALWTVPCFLKSVSVQAHMWLCHPSCLMIAESRHTWQALGRIESNHINTTYSSNLT